MTKIKSLKKSKRSFKKRFYGKRSSGKSSNKLRKRSSRKSSNKLRKRSSRKSRKSLKKKSKKMKVRTNRKIGGKKKQQLGGDLEGDDLLKLNLLLPETDIDYTEYKEEKKSIYELLKSYGFFSWEEDDSESIKQANNEVKQLLQGQEGLELERSDIEKAGTVKELSDIISKVMETSDGVGTYGKVLYRPYSRRGSPGNKYFIQGIDQRIKRERYFKDFQDGQIRVYYAEIGKSDSFPGEIPTHITLTPKQVTRSDLVERRCITLEDIGDGGALGDGGAISVSTLFKGKFDTIPPITIENPTAHVLAEGKYLKLVILPELSDDDVILYQSSVGGWFTSGKYDFASVTDKEGGQMKVHNAPDEQHIPRVYVKINDMEAEKIKSSAELNAEATAEADRVAAEEGQISDEIQTLRTEIAEIVGFTISGYGRTNFVSEIQSYGFGKDPALKSQGDYKVKGEYKIKLEKLKEAIKARNTGVKTAYNIVDDGVNTKGIYQKVKETEQEYGGHGFIIKMDQGKYAELDIAGVGEGIDWAKQWKQKEEDAAQRRQEEADAAEAQRQEATQQAQPDRDQPEQGGADAVAEAQRREAEQEAAQRQQEADATDIDTPTTSTSDKRIKEAVELAKSAVNNDTEGNYTDAIKNYELAAKKISDNITSYSEANKIFLTSLMKEYSDRANELMKLLPQPLGGAVVEGLLQDEKQAQDQRWYERLDQVETVAQQAPSETAVAPTTVTPLSQREGQRVVTFAETSEPMNTGVSADMAFEGTTRPQARRGAVEAPRSEGAATSILRSTRVSPGTSTPSQSVSEALEKIKNALIEKKDNQRV